MKTKIFSAFLFMLLIVGMQGFSQSNASTQSRDLKNFSAISLSIPADVTVKQGDFSFSINSTPEILEKIKTDVKNGELVIRFENTYNNNIHDPIKIEISMPSLVALEVNGSGEINSSSSFTGESLNLEINGSGKIKLSELTYDSFAATINGSGRVLELKGSGGEVKMHVNGSGEINAPGLSGKNVKCEVTGSGNISVSASETLTAEITGSGDIRYGGSPTVKSVNISGSGTVTVMK